MQIIKSIQSSIHEIRGERVILDFDLARLYEVETRVLNQAVKRNIKRFPDDFMFQLTQQELESLKLQMGTQFKDMSSQIVMTYSTKRPNSALPYAFTEQGIAMLSGVLKSEIAINMNIAIMRAFVAVRKIFLQPHEDNERLKELKERIEEHDIQLSQLYDAMDNLLDEKIAQKKWENRERIGFKK
ncbi:hypothetical protein ABIB40_001313 [Pedobacter sp. UYP30]|uniref:ORF6N domain-containing protein n=1 Tax=Pedobacter sp. UYP30 TaxID=1756400 RepID=UPI00339B9461